MGEFYLFVYTFFGVKLMFGSFSVVWIFCCAACIFTLYKREAIQIFRRNFYVEQHY